MIYFFRHRHHHRSCFLLLLLLSSISLVFAQINEREKTIDSVNVMLSVYAILRISFSKPFFIKFRSKFIQLNFDSHAFFWFISFSSTFANIFDINIKQLLVFFYSHNQNALLIFIYFVPEQSAGELMSYVNTWDFRQNVHKNFQINSISSTYIENGRHSTLNGLYLLVWIGLMRMDDDEDDGMYWKKGEWDEHIFFSLISFFFFFGKAKGYYLAN